MKWTVFFCYCHSKAWCLCLDFRATSFCLFDGISRWAAHSQANSSEGKKLPSHSHRYSWGCRPDQGLQRWLTGRESICQCKRRWFDPWVRKIPWRRERQPTPGFLHRGAWQATVREGHKRVGRDLATEHVHTVRTKYPINLTWKDYWNKHKIILRRKGHWGRFLFPLLSILSSLLLAVRYIVVSRNTRLSKYIEWRMNWWEDE